MFFAHAGESHAEPEAASGLLDTIAHEPAWIALLISVIVLLGFYAVLGLLRVKPVTRLLALLPVILALNVLFFSHNPIVATILLSGGFILTFALAFALLRGGN